MYQIESKIISFLHLSCLKSLQRPLLFTRVLRKAALKNPGKISVKMSHVKSAFTKNESCTFPELFFRANFTGKHLCQSLSFIKKETLAQLFSYEFCEISKKTFLTEQFWATASRAILRAVFRFPADIEIESLATIVNG